jgi:hypothetical protein
MGSGEMTEEMYCDLQKKQYLKDLKLLKYFEAVQDEKKAAIVA